MQEISQGINGLLPVQHTNVGDDLLPTINMRDLWEFLGSKRDYSNWIKDRIDNYGFQQDIDFVQLDFFVESNSKPRKEYFFSIDAAKQVAMVERNEKGRTARLYFIECEKQLNDPVTLMAKSLIWADKQMRVKDVRIGELEHKVDDLSTKLGDNENWKRVSAIPWLKSHFDMTKAPGVYQAIGKELTRMTRLMGIEKKFAKSYMYANAIGVYHMDVINNLEEELKKDGGFMEEYRRPRLRRRKNATLRLVA